MFDVSVKIPPGAIKGLFDRLDRLYALLSYHFGDPEADARELAARRAMPGPKVEERVFHVGERELEEQALARAVFRERKGYDPSDEELDDEIGFLRKEGAI